MKHSPPRVALVGTRGYGARHLATLRELHEDKRIILAALIDREFEPGSSQTLPDTRLSTDLESVLGADEGLDSLVIATPPHTHYELARLALKAEVSVYLEKPPVPYSTQLKELQELTGARRVEVGFQQARAIMTTIAQVLQRHDLGSIDRVTAYGVLQRDDHYFNRASWAGKWFLGDEAVFDGPLFNPCAHVLHTAFLICKMLAPEWQPHYVHAECYSLRGNGGDDLSALRVRSKSTGGPVVLAAATTAGDNVLEPGIILHGSRGKATIRHRDAVTEVELATGEKHSYPSPRGIPHGLMEAVEHPLGAADPYMSLEAVEPFVRVVEGVVMGVGEPTPIKRYASVKDDGGGRFVQLEGIAEDVMQLIRSGKLFGETSVSWASTPRLFTV